MNKLLFLIWFVLYPVMSYCQTVGVKTNVLYWATSTPNFGLEIATSKRTTLEWTVGFNPWTFKNNKKLKHVSVSPEFRYWTCEKFNGHFIGIHGSYAYYNVGGIKLPFGITSSLRNHRFQGSVFEAGFTYGYQWMIGKRWNLEALIGIGYANFSYDKFNCSNCGAWEGKEKKNYVGPTKAALSLIYLIK